jgi:hypothetical protein
MKDMSAYEASDFWDEHDFGEFEDVVEVEEVRFALREKKYVGIDEELFAAIRRKAKTLNKPAEALIHEWLSEKAVSS